MRCTATAPHVSYLLGSRERAEPLIDGVLVPGLIGKERDGEYLQPRLTVCVGISMLSPPPVVCMKCFSTVLYWYARRSSPLGEEKGPRLQKRGAAVERQINRQRPSL